MKLFYVLLMVILVSACNERENKKITGEDSLQVEQKHDATVKLKEPGIMELSDSILICLKNKDFSRLSEYVHPQQGVRFSPYAHIDTVTDRLFTKEALASLASNNKKINWGSYDAGEEEIILDPKKYFSKFVYDVDFINAKEKTVNSSHASGNMINNIKEVYPDDSYSEFYFPGFDPKYDGMDWRALRLVFKKEKEKLYLIGVIHDQWTI
jgi:hypothetical protein